MAQTKTTAKTAVKLKNRFSTLEAVKYLASLKDCPITTTKKTLNKYCRLNKVSYQREFGLNIYTRRTLDALAKRLTAHPPKLGRPPRKGRPAIK